MTSAAIARLALGLVFLYHGLVPKLLFLSPDEVRMIEAHGWPLSTQRIAEVAGAAEIVLALAILLLRRSRWPLWLAAAALLGLLVDVALFAPELLLGAFNPVSTNVAALALCAIALLGERDATPPRPPPLR
ncbi:MULTISPECIES: DoxX-like family protein [Pseudomonas]|uniref:DoxX family protein n=1 Tax=Pseudomonas nitroreducens TaxID=46680 RepID=A0A6G6IST4_PSENT|nr:MULTISPECIES: DoxX-like family protein [Pseudomonas]MCJ1879928.1 DoxX-like family protein [Pseudomonas nitroreducens]MCJ1894129.1 DoxX-like family protein [Pseudomonas nitroreducens]OBY61119.1 DoxX family protein [Pseudomonas sp. AU12215]QIE86256.1 DoxX family protein [Pseudomonas nitroreducens]UCL88512.1 DoxX-like family protein [Pseudomonas sp. HS-18]